MNLVSENVSRKIDSLGRVGIPKGLRDRLEINTNDELEFFVLNHDNGEQYICFTNHKIKDNQYAIAAQVLTELGIELPEKLVERL